MWSHRDRVVRIGALLAVLATVTEAAAQGQVRVKLATQAPDGSPWHRILEDMGHEWQETTGGRVRLVIYPGGVAGDDGATLRKIRHRQLQGTTLTVGLSDLDAAFNVFRIPFFFESTEEVFYVLDRLTPLLEERLAEQGFVNVHWGYGGWLHIFSNRPTPSVEDLRGLKMYTGATDRMVRLWRQNGFNPVSLSTSDIMVGLQSGMIDGLPASPLIALAFQWFRRTPYMLDPGFAPLIGATLIDVKTWEKLSESDRAAILAVSREAGDRLAEEIPRKDEEALSEMIMRGLQVIRVDLNGGDDRWRSTADDFAASFRAAMVPEEVFDLALRYRNEYRRRDTAAAGSQP
jgi:TRAP-type C4-dicarboxylate transport system substrate-binding protein